MLVLVCSADEWTRVTVCVTVWVTPSQIMNTLSNNITNYNQTQYLPRFFLLGRNVRNLTIFLGGGFYLTDSTTQTLKRRVLFGKGLLSRQCAGRCLWRCLFSTAMRCKSSVFPNLLPQSFAAFPTAATPSVARCLPTVPLPRPCSRFSPDGDRFQSDFPTCEYLKNNLFI